jgi:hypothetical protein
MISFGRAPCDEGVVRAAAETPGCAERARPTVGAVDVAGTQLAAFQIAKLVEQKQRIIAGAFIMAVPDAVLLFAMRRAHARIHIEHDAARRTASINAIDPSAGKISKSGKVLFGCEPARLESGPFGSARPRNHPTDVVARDDENVGFLADRLL